MTIHRPDNFLLNFLTEPSYKQRWVFVFNMSALAVLNERIMLIIIFSIKLDAKDVHLWKCLDLMFFIRTVYSFVVFHV